MEPKLQRRVQRYGWDLAAPMIEGVAIARGERVLDVACGTGLVTFRVAEAVGPGGYVVGTDISGEMTDAARVRARQRGLTNTMFYRMEAERLTLPDDESTWLCALGLGASGWRCGASDPGADGPRCFQSLKLRSRVMSARCSSVSGSEQHLQVCVKKRDWSMFRRIVSARRFFIRARGRRPTPHSLVGPLPSRGYGSMSTLA